jgi:hypothetical protein
MSLTNEVLVALSEPQNLDQEHQNECRREGHVLSTYPTGSLQTWHWTLRHSSVGGNDYFGEKITMKVSNSVPRVSGISNCYVMKTRYLPGESEPGSGMRPTNPLPLAYHRLRP